MKTSFIAPALLAAAFAAPAFAAPVTYNLDPSHTYPPSCSIAKRRPAPST
jgi:hypothetical protein